MVARFILQALDIEVFRIQFNTFTLHLTACKSDITTCINHGFTLAITYMACDISGFITITVTFSVITAESNPSNRTITHFNGYPRIKTTRFIGTTFLVVLFCGFDIDLVICHQCRASLTWDVWTFNINVRILSCACRHNIYFAASINLGFIGCCTFSMRARFIFLLAISDLYTNHRIYISCVTHKFSDIICSLSDRLSCPISIKTSISCCHRIHTTMLTFTYLSSWLHCALYCLNSRNNRRGNSNS